MKFEKKIEVAKAMPDSDLKLSTMETLALQAIPHSSTQKALQVEIKRLYKAGYKIRIPEKYQPKASTSNEKYEVHIVGSKSASVIYDNKAQAEKAKRDNELFGFETTIKKVEHKKEKKDMAEKKKKDNKLTVEIVTYNQGQSTEHFGLAAKDGPLQAAPKWKTKAGAARWAKKNGYNLNDIKELSKDIPSRPKKDAEKEAKVKLAGEVYDLMILNHTPEQRKRLPSRESYIQNQFKPVIIGGRNFGTITMKELEDAKAELLQKFSQKKADKTAPKTTPVQPKRSPEKPVAKRSESKPVVPKKQQANVIHKDDKELVIRFKTDNSAGKAGYMITVKKGEKGWSDGKHNYFVSHLRNSDFIEIIGRGQGAEKPAAPKNEPTVAKKPAGAKKSAVDKLLQHSDKDEMNVAGEKPIVINGANAKPKHVPKVLRKVAKTGGYTAWDDIKRNGKTFATEKEAKDYAAALLKKTGKVAPISPTDRQVTHTFKPEEEKKKK